MADRCAGFVTLPADERMPQAALAFRCSLFTTSS